jgi:2-keto-4-pentenoate hydratase
LTETEPQRVARGLEAQLAHEPEVIGWKIGLNVRAVQEHLGLDAPVIGHLTKRSLIEPGASHSVAGGTRICVEPEVAIHLGEDGRIEGFGPAIEVVDLDPAMSELQDILAGNVFHRGVVLGAVVPGISATDLGDLTATVSRNGAVEQTARYADAGEEPGEVLRIVDERLASVGRRPAPGQVVIAGSLTPMVAVQAGDRIEVDLQRLGALALGLS